jgi:hypothetical protein
MELIKDWKLPAEFSAVIAHHHTDREPQAEWSLTEAIKVSCRMADAAGFPAFPGCECLSYTDLLDEVPKEVCEHMNPDVAVLTHEIAEAIYHVEHV